MSKKLKIIMAIIMFLIIAIASVVLIFNISKSEIYLTQLASQTNDGMMGYFIRTSEGRTIIIDGGLKGESDHLKQYIEKYGNKVDYWFITHPHKDHVGAFIEIVQNSNIEIEKIYYSANTIEWYDKNKIDYRVEEIEKFYKAISNERIKDSLIEPKIGDEIEIEKNIKIQILGIKNEEITTNPINNSSMVFKLLVNNKNILFLGDTGIESSKKLISQYGEKLKSDIVQMAHHGQAGATEELYKLVNPDICLWPTPIWLWDNNSGEGYNSGDWKTLETREWMTKLNVKEHYVAKDGDITITIK